jgi:hypothetical protein
MTRLTLALTIAVLVLPVAGFAQTTPTSPTPPTQGPLVLERIHTNFVVAPDYKITELDGEVAHLAGAYAGWLTEDTLLVGGAAYSVANRTDDFKLTYGGLVAGWTLFPDRRIQFGARGLVGLGRATLGTDVAFARFGRGGRDTRVSTRPQPVPETVRFRIEDDFFVFEPQLAVVTRLTNHIAINVGAGYRLTAYAERLDDRVNGASGSIGVQLGGW